MLRRKGFTLIELLVVIAIIAILAAILFPIFRAAQDTAKKSVCQSNLKELSQACLMYEGDNGGKIMPGLVGHAGDTGIWVPMNQMWTYFADQYVKQNRKVSATDTSLRGIFVCPARFYSRDSRTGQEIPENVRRTYGYNMSYLGGWNAQTSKYEYHTMAEAAKPSKTVRIMEFWNIDNGTVNSTDPDLKYYSKGRGSMFSYAQHQDPGYAKPWFCWPPGWHAGGLTAVCWLDGHVSMMKTPPIQSPTSPHSNDYNWGVMADSLPGINNSWDPYFRLANPKP